MNDIDKIMLFMKIKFDQEGNSMLLQKSWGYLCYNWLQKIQIREDTSFSSLLIPRRYIPQEASEYVTRSSNNASVVFYPNDKQCVRVQEKEMGKHSKRNKAEDPTLNLKQV